ncbi:MAG: hypothetical protein KUG79_09140 [Pseudomonadales bacterium]|nr:hypothetical protein [Pseudomonadales bacterium]
MSVVLEQRPSSLPPGLNRSTVYARQRRAANDESGPRRSRKKPTQPRALKSEERAQVVEVLHS